MIRKGLKVLVLSLLLLFVTTTVYAGSLQVKANFQLSKSDHKEIGKGKGHKEIDKDDRAADEDDRDSDEDHRDTDNDKDNGKSDKKINREEGKQSREINRKEKKPKFVNVTGITLNKTSTTITAGSWERLVATVQPGNAANKRVLWCSSNPQVATVNPSGKVTGISSGEAEIYAIVCNGFKTASCKVTVTDDHVNVPVTGISLNKTSTIINVGARETLVATVQPSNATDKKVLWFSADPTAVAVVPNGTVTGLKTGTTLIYAVTRDGFHVVSCQVTVNSSTANIPVTGVSLDHTSLDMTLGSAHRLVAAITPDNASNKAVWWSTSNPGIVTVDQSGNIGALREGTAIVTVRTVDNDRSASCSVNVKKYATEVPVTSVSITKITPYAAVKVGSVKHLTVTVEPDNATNKSVTWSSSNSNIASVDQSGFISGVAEGTATITVTTVNGAKSDWFTVRVIPSDKWVSVTGIHLNLLNSTIPLGFVEDLRYRLDPATASELEVRWSSSNSAVATVNIFGEVEGKGTGTAIIAATTVDGSKTAACFVTVVPALDKPVNGILFNKIAGTIAVGEIDYPRVIKYPAGTATPAVSWTTSNSAVATVTQNGEVTGVSSGTAIITAETADNKTAGYIITVVPRS